VPTDDFLLPAQVRLTHAVGNWSLVLPLLFDIDAMA
jgi:hypothetical protein